MAAAVASQECPYTRSRCIKVRKSTPDQTIGTCTLSAGGRSVDPQPVIICPHRLIEGGLIFRDAAALLRPLERDEEYRVIPEFTIPGGSVDYVVAIVHNGVVKDFVGLELQTLDTTGTVWPDRNRLMQELGLDYDPDAATSTKSFGFNWKMTAKTILMQLHHKGVTFQSVDKKLVLILQTPLLDYMERDFNFGHLSSPPAADDSIVFQAYDYDAPTNRLHRGRALGTDPQGLATALGLQRDGVVDLDTLLLRLTASLVKSRPI
jgi:hypothetical protein